MMKDEDLGKYIDDMAGRLQAAADAEFAKVATEQRSGEISNLHGVVALATIANISAQAMANALGMLNVSAEHSTPRGRAYINDLIAIAREATEKVLTMQTAQCREAAKGMDKDRPGGRLPR